MNEKDKAEFLKDFKDADIQKKLDMWFYALTQDGLWGEILAEMSDIAQHLTRGQTVAAEE
ncbi:MAG: hypothetical protein JW771_05110 [Candidatus Thermoplasmatota archaeon]|nr:hypothetical protein [Candidatus Thermoplasmatota archaeon]